MRILLKIILIFSLTNIYSQNNKYYINISEYNENIKIVKDSCDNITKIIMNVDRPDTDSFKVFYAPLDNGVYQNFNDNQSKFYLNIKEQPNIVDYQWFYKEETAKKIAFYEDKAEVYFLRKFNNY